MSWDGRGASEAMLRLMPSDPLSVEQVCDLLAEAGIFPSSPSAYRTLERLAACGALMRDESVTPGGAVHVTYAASPLARAAQECLFGMALEAPDEA